MAMEDTEFMRSLVEAETGAAAVKTLAIQRLHVLMTGEGSTSRAVSLAAIQAIAARFAALA